MEKDANLRDLNGAMSLVLLRLFEEDPQRWESVRWLNHQPSPEGETFPEYLQKWLNAVPDRHKPFVLQIARLYGLNWQQTLPSASSSQILGKRKSTMTCDSTFPHSCEFGYPDF